MFGDARLIRVVIVTQDLLEKDQSVCKKKVRMLEESVSCPRVVILDGVMTSHVKKNLFLTH